MNELEHLRSELRAVDRDILETLGRRNELIQKIGAYKARIGRQVTDPDQEQKNRAERGRLAAECGLDAGFVERVFAELVKESKRVQSESGKVSK